MATSGFIGVFVSLIFLLQVFAVELAPTGESEIDKNKPWHDLVVRRFFGPWTILHNKNGDYIDYADYGGLIRESLEVGSSDSFNEPSLESNGYTDELALSYEEILPEFSSIYNLSPMGLAVFRTGISSGKTDDKQPLEETKDFPEEIRTNSEEVTQTPDEETTSNQSEDKRGN